ncbi:hypothetical protein EYC58_04710 [Candidatus Saccharibacteria bacterium]|nr:MAG: hypothetical protein EYC58_04710 [Candidatus Saccharibacteria bacterium]
MKTTILREITLYRYRYLIGYMAFGLLFLALLLVGVDQAPRGLSAQEMSSAVTSVNLRIFNPIATNVVDAPYHILQKASIHYLGLSSMALKLPSIIIGAITGIGIVFMLQKWFRKNVAIITASIIVTSVGFLSLARTGTPMIMTAFWTVMLLLGATHVLHGEKHQFLWKLFCFVCIALLAYSPFGIYPLLVMTIAGIIHPHVRYRLKQGEWWQHLISAITVLTILGPLIVSVIHTPSIALSLLGMDQLHQFQLSHILGNTKEVLSTLFNFTSNTSEHIVKPIFGIATTVLLIFGILKLFTASYSARSYMLFIWLLVLVPLLLIRPDMVLLVIVPATLILAIGIETLIRQWYDIFPRNPYARIAALIPLTILVISIVGINMERYFYGNHYSSLAADSHAELPAVRAVLDSHQLGKTRPVVISVPADQVSFYDILRREFPRVSVNSDPTKSSPPVIVLASTTPQLTARTPTRILTNDLSQDNRAILLRVYSR